MYMCVCMYAPVCACLCVNTDVLSPRPETPPAWEQRPSLDPRIEILRPPRRGWQVVSLLLTRVVAAARPLISRPISANTSLAAPPSPSLRRRPKREARHRAPASAPSAPSGTQKRRENCLVRRSENRGRGAAERSALSQFSCFFLSYCFSVLFLSFTFSFSPTWCLSLCPPQAFSPSAFLSTPLSPVP